MVFPLKGVKDLREVLVGRVSEVLGAFGLGAAQVEFEIEAVREGCIAKRRAEVCSVPSMILPFSWRLGGSTSSPC